MSTVSAHVISTYSFVMASRFQGYSWKDVRPRFVCCGGWGIGIISLVVNASHPGGSASCFYVAPDALRPKVRLAYFIIKSLVFHIWRSAAG